MPLLVALGFAAGTFIAILTVAAEHSRLAFNSYALYGNGALIVPALLAPFALYPGWVWALRHGARALELGLYVLGLHFGVGVVSVLEVLFFPAQSDLGPADVMPGFLLSGAIFVLPAALLAAGSLWLASRLERTVLIPVTVVAIVVASFLGVLYGAGLGILSGGAVAIARRAPDRAALIGAVLFVLVVAVGNVAYVPALLTP
jgi:hypothetical protein